MLRSLKHCHMVVLQVNWYVPFFRCLHIYVINPVDNKRKKRLVNCKHKYHVRRFREIVLMSSISRSCPRHHLNLFLTLGKQMSSNDRTAVIQSYSLPQQRILSPHNQIEKSVLLPTTKHGFIYHEVWAKSDTRLHVGAGENKVSGQFLTSSNLFSGGFPYQAI